MRGRRALTPVDGLRAAGPRVALRPARAEDEPSIRRWEEAAERPPAGDKTLVITPAGEDGAIGALWYRLEGRDGAIISCVTLAEGSRRRGLGQDAVRLFEEAAGRQMGVQRFRTEVPGSVGLALYFWLRLGYRPLGPGKDPQGLDILRMAREP